MSLSRYISASSDVIEAASTTTNSNFSLVSRGRNTAKSHIERVSTSFGTRILHPTSPLTRFILCSIPLPEGLAPLSPQSLDADLDRIIERYTLQGISVLVHCRGGVGRAGVFACCWMLKLGLCGWIETDVLPTTTSDDAPPEWNTDTIVRRGTLQLVERAIEVARRRRSVKAIETLEQVQFLVEYVDYLRTCGRIGGDSSNS